MGFFLFIFPINLHISALPTENCFGPDVQCHLHQNSLKDSFC